MVGDGDHVLVVLHHQNRVALVPELPQQVVHAVNVTGVHPGAGFVEDIGHACQAAAHVPHQLESLGLAAGEGRCIPVQMEIGQANLNHPVQPFDDGLHQHPTVWSVICDRTSRSWVSSMAHMSAIE